MDSTIEAAMGYVHALAARAGTDQTTPLAMLTLENPGESGTTLGISFTALPRDPDWTGLSTMLPYLRGLEMNVHEPPRRRGRPGFAVAAPWRCGPAGKRALPPGEARTLRDIAMHHGATVCRWVSMRG